MLVLSAPTADFPRPQVTGDDGPEQTIRQEALLHRTFGNYNRPMRISIALATRFAIVGTALAQLPPESMVNRHLVRGALCAALLLAVGSLAATPWEKNGVNLDSSVRMVARDAATCEVSPDGQSPEAYEAMKANHGQPLHMWHLDYSAYNGSGRVKGGFWCRS